MLKSILVLQDDMVQGKLQIANQLGGQKKINKNYCTKNNAPVETPRERNHLYFHLYRIELSIVFAQIDRQMVRKIICF